MKEYYAVVLWCWEDVQNAHPDWNETRCRAWLEANEKWFRDVLTEYGNEILSNTIDN